MELSDNEILARIKMGEKFCKKYVKIDKQASAKFRDASNDYYVLDDDDDDDEEGGNLPDDMPVAQPNQLTTNLITKNAAVAIGDPDFLIKIGQEETHKEIVRTFLRAKWRLYNWVRLTRRVQLKKDLIGLGVVQYRWDKEKRSCFEYVKTDELAIDPNATDFSNLEFAGRKIKMSLRKAMTTFDKKNFDVSEGASDGYLDKKKVDVWLYWDKDEEVVIYNNKVIKRGENRYHSIPLVFHEGDPDPNDVLWSLGDFQLAAGLQAELSDINAIISDAAKYGRGKTLVNVEQLGKGGQEALENGNDVIAVKDTVTPPIIRTQGQQLEATLLEAKREIKVAFDGITGVTQYQRGTMDYKADFATSVAAMAQQSGARAVLAQKEFERFVTKMAEIVVMLEREFGGAYYDDGGEMQATDEEIILWEAMNDVEEVHVIESSTLYKDPNFDLQQSMQLLNVIAQLMPLMAQVGQRLPNLESYIEDVLRASGKHDMGRYWAQMPPQQLQPQQQLQQGQPQPVR